MEKEFIELLFLHIEELTVFIHVKISSLILHGQFISSHNQYALKTNDGEYYLESMEDRALQRPLLGQFYMLLPRIR